MFVMLGSVGGVWSTRGPVWQILGGTLGLSSYQIECLECAEAEEGEEEEEEEEVCRSLGHAALGALPLGPVKTLSPVAKVGHYIDPTQTHACTNVGSTDAELHKQSNNQSNRPNAQPSKQSINQSIDGWMNVSFVVGK